MRDRNLEKIENILFFHRPKPINVEDRFSVFVPFMKIEGEICVVYELRALSLRRQPGEISFPGGKMEKGESPRYAAVRELCEELLIPSDKVQLFGETDYLITRGTSQIYSFAGLIKDIEFEDIRPNVDEVEKLFYVPLRWLMENEPKKYTMDVELIQSEDFPFELIPNGKDYKFYKGVDEILFYEYEDYVIWGFTAKITDRLIRILKENNFSF